MGAEADYAVMKYGRKVDCLRSPDKVGKEAGTRRLNKGSKRATDDEGEGVLGITGSGNRRPIIKQRGGGGGSGMNPLGILTGLRRQRGEVVWWTVYNSVL